VMHQVNSWLIETRPRMGSVEVAAVYVVKFSVTKNAGHRPASSLVPG